MVGDFLEVQQIFHGTIKENILLGRDFDTTQLDYLIGVAGLADYIYQLPLGLETILQPEGKGLSKALAQQIIVARGLVGHPKALIMENTLKHVNPELKAKLIEIFLNGSWTLVMISDDEEILKRADKILIMDAGKVVFQGNYEGYRQFKI